MDNIRHKFGQHLKRLRLQYGMTQQQLAEKADISISFLGNIERGLKSPTIETVQKIATALGMSMAELFEPEAKLTSQNCKPRQQQICKILCECIEKIDQIYSK